MLFVMHFTFMFVVYTGLHAFEVITHRAFGELQRSRDLALANALAGQGLDGF